LDEALEFAQQIITQVIMTFGYPGVFLVMLSENLIPILPSELILPFAGFLVYTEELSLLGVLIAATIGTTIGASVMYFLGARVGMDRLRHFFRRYGKYLLLREKDLDKSMSFFERHGKKSVIFGMLLPGVRNLISIPAGLDRMPLRKFLVIAVFSTATWNIIWIGIGMWLGRNWMSVLEFVDAYELFFGGVIVILILFLIIRRLRESKTKKTTQE
jgi:membrane protein DedA with SNARE-associated domain